MEKLVVNNTTEFKQSFSYLQSKLYHSYPSFELYVISLSFEAASKCFAERYSHKKTSKYIVG